MKKRILAVFMASLFLVGMQVSTSKSASADPQPWKSAYDLRWENRFDDPNWVNWGPKSFWEDLTNVRISGNYKYRVLSEEQKTATFWGVLNEQKKS